MDAVALTPVHLDKVMDGLAMNSALPAPMVRRLFAWRRGGGKVARRPDLTEDMFAEIIAIDDHWLLHGLALNDRLSDRFRIRLAAHRDKAVRSALVIHAAACSTYFAHGPHPIPLSDLLPALLADPVTRAR